MIIKIAAVGIIICLISLILKDRFRELVLPIEMLFLSVVLVSVFREISEKISSLNDYLNGVSIGGEVFSSLMKCSFVCILCKFACDVCIENGSSLIADVIEISGKIVLIAIAYPFIEGIINTAIAFVE